MNGVVFYKDSVDTFECDIKIDGASSSKSKARLVMEFSDRTLLFNGEIRDGHVSVKIPKLSEINEDGGNATLEVIAEQTYFEAWKSPFDLRNKKNVAIKEVRINRSSNNVIVENVSKVQKQTPQRKPSILRESCSERNVQFVNESFSKFKTLNKRDKSIIQNEMKKFKPKSTISEWSKMVFNDPTTQYAKYCMFVLQNPKFKG